MTEGIATLPADYCRCRDKTCKLRRKCLRYLQREKNVNKHTPYSDSLWTYDAKVCRAFIQKPE